METLKMILSYQNRKVLWRAGWDLNYASMDCSLLEITEGNLVVAGKMTHGAYKA